MPAGSQSPFRFASASLAGLQPSATLHINVRVQFNQRDEGLMGAFGENVTWVFLPNQKSTPTPGAPPAPSAETPAPAGTKVP